MINDNRNELVFEQAFGSVGQSVGFGYVLCGKLQVRGSVSTCVFYQYRLVYEFVLMTCSAVLHKLFWTIETGKKREKTAIYLWMSSSYENGKFSFFSTEEWACSRPSRFNFRLQAVTSFLLWVPITLFCVSSFVIIHQQKRGRLALQVLYTVQFPCGMLIKLKWTLKTVRLWKFLLKLEVCVQICVLWNLELH